MILRHQSQLANNKYRCPNVQPEDSSTIRYHINVEQLGGVVRDWTVIESRRGVVAAERE